MSKTKTTFFCQNCGSQSPKWVGKCPNCGEWNTFVEEVVQKETKVISIIWHPSNPLRLLIRPLEQLQKLATQANIPYTNQ